ncbi:MAG TPA: Gfo/Idh/MocA family oxidoreductase [Candidatus Binataceae bacterium]|nr:Gfo/Idh/MocA family oxidoreductase [Candidatus Binataceae bacterium]
MVKVLLLGVGRWGSNHLRVARSLPVELYVADPAADRLDLARKAGVKELRLSSDPLAFKSAVDAVVIATPAPSHFDLCKEFLGAGKDVFVEKPITLEAVDALALVELAERRGRILQVGHIFRFDTATQWLRDSIAGGEFGQLRILRGCFSGFKRPRHDTGVMFADAIHFVDLFNFILDRSPIRVSAVTEDFLSRGMEDEALIVMDYPPARAAASGSASNVTARVEAGYHLPGKYREVVVAGDRMSAICDYNVAQYKVRTFRNHHLPRPAGRFEAVEGEMHQLEFSPEEPLHTEWRAFLDSVETRQAPLADGMAGYHAVRVIEAALASARSGRRVDLKARE